MRRFRRWRRCAQGGHRPHVYEPTIVPNKVIVRCDCGRGIWPSLVYVESL